MQQQYQLDLSFENSSSCNLIPFIDGIPHQPYSETTVVPNTVGTYSRISKMVKSDLGGDRLLGLDYGAGHGLGADVMRELLGAQVDTYEPQPLKWKSEVDPVFTRNVQMDDCKYDFLTAVNVVNVLEKHIRDSVVVDIFNKLKKGGRAYLGVRTFSADVNKTKNKREADEHKAVWVKKRHKTLDIEVFHKGWDGNEFVDYLQGLLGDGAIVQKKKIAATGAIIEKVGNLTL